MSSWLCLWDRVSYFEMFANLETCHKGKKRPLCNDEWLVTSFDSINISKEIASIASIVSI